ncbi:hypothetical protein POTOM_009911 [Populus tomentosa]|uniref:Uncharacterized protein n=1 Tax=Populus tomentosa TaxID=118781 RepID=A0A8X8ANR3_POPTO|nr:hypothetical protein POTOM_009911 [Populus tomentosa]
MESSSSSSLSHWDYLGLLILRPVLAILFVFSFIYIGWCLAWKLVLEHVPLVQDIFGPRKNPTKPKPLTLRISRIYDTIDPRYLTPAGFCKQVTWGGCGPFCVDSFALHFISSAHNLINSSRSAADLTSWFLACLGGEKGVADE